MLYDQQLKSPLQCVQGLTPSKQHQGLRPDRNGRCCRGCPRHWKFMSQFVLSACFTCLKQQLQTISQSQTNAHKKPEEVGVPGLCFRGRNSGSENRWDLPSHSRRQQSQLPLATCRPSCKPHSSSSLPDRLRENPSSSHPRSCRKRISQQQDQPCRSESPRQPQAGKKQRLGISSFQSFRRGSE